MERRRLVGFRSPTLSTQHALCFGTGLVQGPLEKGSSYGTAHGAWLVIRP